jgi:membrane peptidoglycan carboxypeptidase
MADMNLVLPLPYRLPVVPHGYVRLLASARHAFDKRYRALYFLAVLFGVPALGWSVAFANLPDVEDPAVWSAPESVTVADRGGGGMYYAYLDEDRVWIDGEDIPDVVKAAFVGIEDKRYWERGCVDWRAIGRASYQNLRSYKSQGASTITQQLVRTALLTREKTFSRKFKEILLACQLENTMSKDDILEQYLNWISFGGGVAGIRQASRHFFDKEPRDLTVAEAAVLAAMPQRPTYFSPYGPHRYSAFAASGSTVDTSNVVIGLTGTSATLPGGASLERVGRAHQVVATLRERGYLDDAGRAVADEELMRMAFRPKARRFEAPYYTLRVLQETKELVPDSRGRKITVETTIDTELQRKAEAIVREYAETARTRFGANSVALVLADLETREILAYVGNTDYFASSTGAKIDMATMPRQVGSTMKPIVYAAAMNDVGWTPTTIVDDSPLTIGGTRPRNYEGGFKGKMTLIRALNHSRNIPAIRAFQEVGEDSVLDLAEAIGAPHPKKFRLARSGTGGTFDYDWPLAIGAAEIPLTEMVQAYATLGNGGVYKPLRGIRSITVDGEVMAREDDGGTRAVPQSVADAVTSMLSESRARPAGFWRTVTDVPGTQEAVKTGTSNVCLERTSEGCKKMLPRDTWAIGYTPEFIVGVWVGNPDGAPLAANADGLNAAVPMWREMLVAAHERYEDEDLAVAFANEAAPYYASHPVADPANAPQDPTAWPTWITPAAVAAEPRPTPEIAAQTY